MRWLVTGAGGMLGQDAIGLLLGRGHDVTALSRADLDITDREAATSAAGGHDVVLNCAAWTAVDDAEEQEGQAFLVNAVGPAVLATAARQTGALLVTVSTDYVFDGAASTPYPNDHPMRPVSAYGRTKAAGEWAVRAETSHHLILRTAWLYGADGACFPKITNLIDGGTVPLYGEGTNVRDWLHVDDHCRGIHLVLTGGQPGEIYNIGGGTELTNKELTGLLLEATGTGWERVQSVQDRLGHDLRYSVDISKIKRELGYEPRVPFEQGLSETVRWLVDNRSWWEPLKARAGLT